MFGKQSTSRLRRCQLACVMEHLQYEEGETIFSQGDAPDGVYMIDEGFERKHASGDRRRLVHCQPERG